MKRKIFKKAFTLAEVLVTLMILGVIASMTIPGLKKTSDEKQFVDGCLKALSTLATGASNFKHEHGPLALTNAMSLTAFESVGANKDSFAGTFAAIHADIPPKYEMKVLDLSSSITPEKTSGRYMTTPDGFFYYIYTADGTVSQIIVDVNGFKEPNIMGVDIYGFNLYKNGTVEAMGSGKNLNDLRATCQGGGQTDNPASTGDSDKTLPATVETSLYCTAIVIADKDISW